MKRAVEPNSLCEDLNEEFATADRLAEKDKPESSCLTQPARASKEPEADLGAISKSKSLFAEISKDSESSSLKRSTLPWQLCDKTPAFGPDEKEEMKQADKSFAHADPVNFIKFNGYQEPIRSYDPIRRGSKGSRRSSSASAVSRMPKDVV